MLKKYINIMNLFIFSCLIIDILADLPGQNYSQDNDVESFINDSLYDNFRGHKCKKSKCYCSLRVRNSVKAENITVRDSARASSLKATSVNANTVNATNINTSTINGAYPVLNDYGTTRMIRGAIFPPDGFGIKIKLIPQPTSVPSSPYPYQAEISYTLNGQPVPALPFLSSGKGFKVGPLLPELSVLSDASYYGFGPFSDLDISGLGGQNEDFFTIALIVPIEFDKSFLSFPIITTSEYFNKDVLFGKGAYGQSGSISLDLLRSTIFAPSEKGFYLSYLIVLSIVGTQKSGPIQTIEFNLEDILEKDLLKCNFIAVETSSLKKIDDEDKYSFNILDNDIRKDLKCFCKLDVKKNLKCSDTIIKDEILANNIEGQFLDCKNIEAKNIEFSKINNEDNQVLAEDEQIKVIAGGLYSITDEYLIKIKLIPSPNVIYPYKIESEVTLKDGTPVDGLPYKAIGSGFMVGIRQGYDLLENKISKIRGLDLSYYGAYPQGGFTIAAVPEQDLISVYLNAIIHIQFDKPFNSVPIIHQTGFIGGPGVTFDEAINNLYLAVGSYGKPGTVAIRWPRILPINITKEGFDLFVNTRYSISGTQSPNNLNIINENFSILETKINTTSFGSLGFIAYGT